MDQRTRLSPRLAPLPADPALEKQFEAFKKFLGFVPNSLLIMQRKPEMVRAFAQMMAAVWDPESTVDCGFERLLAHVASRAAGCQYCMAHTIEGALHFGVDEKKAPNLELPDDPALYRGRAHSPRCRSRSFIGAERRHG
jgi:alkylhydroperoxidase family enzyme